MKKVGGARRRRCSALDEDEEASPSTCKRFFELTSGFHLQKQTRQFKSNPGEVVVAAADEALRLLVVRPGNAKSNSNIMYSVYLVFEHQTKYYIMIVRQ